MRPVTLRTLFGRIGVFAGPPHLDKLRKKARKAGLTVVEFIDREFETEYKRLGL